LNGGRLMLTGPGGNMPQQQVGGNQYLPQQQGFGGQGTPNMFGGGGGNMGGGAFYG